MFVAYKECWYLIDLYMFTNPLQTLTLLLSDLGREPEWPMSNTFTLDTVLISIPMIPIMLLCRIEDT